MANQSYVISATTLPTSFQFISSGSSGEYHHYIQYMAATEIQNRTVFNLAFGPLDEHGQIDDSIETNNKDVDLVLTSVAKSAEKFLSSFPSAIIGFYGSDDARHRLYRQKITANLPLLETRFHLLGQINGAIEKFVPNRDYQVYYAMKK